MIQRWSLDINPGVGDLNMTARHVEKWYIDELPTTLGRAQHATTNDHVRTNVVRRRIMASSAVRCPKEIITNQIQPVLGYIIYDHLWPTFFCHIYQLFEMMPLNISTNCFYAARLALAHHNQRTRWFDIWSIIIVVACLSHTHLTAAQKSFIFMIYLWAPHMQSSLGGKTRIDFGGAPFGWRDHPIPSRLLLTRVFHRGTFAARLADSQCRGEAMATLVGEPP